MDPNAQWSATIVDLPSMFSEWERRPAAGADHSAWVLVPGDSVGELWPMRPPAGWLAQPTSWGRRHRWTGPTSVRPLDPRGPSLRAKLFHDAAPRGRVQQLEAGAEDFALPVIDVLAP